MSKKALQIDPADDVAVVTEDVQTGEEVQLVGTDTVIVAAEEIRTGHKIALTDLKAGQSVNKYGIPIGRAKDDIEKGSWVHCHNLEDTTEELCNTYCEEYLKKEKTIQAYPRKNGSFGVANYIVIFPTSRTTNELAERLSDASGAIWMVCDRYQLENDALSKQMIEAIEGTAKNPNIYASLLLVDDENSEYETIAKKVGSAGGNMAVLRDSHKESDYKEGLTKITGWQKEVADLKRQPVALEGLTISVHCAGSDWTTALSGNTALGEAAERLIADGGIVYMDEWAGFPGSEHLLAEHAAARKTGVELIRKVEQVRAHYLEKTGKTIEETNPYPSNKEGGITTLVEKSTGNIKKAGNAVLQGIIKPGERPIAPGLYLLDQICGAPASTAAYGAMSGCHINVLVSGVGYIYDEIPHLLDIRMTGNPKTFQQPEFLLDFNAGRALEDLSLEETGKLLYEYIIAVAEGREVPQNEKEKSSAFIMPYPDDKFAGEEYILVQTYKEKHKEKVNAIKG
ncbi:MAG: UxaA family hydrolase [Eubacterium sp.]|nr:UxaA family hydrolase [Eubacterium sp.]